SPLPWAIKLVVARTHIDIAGPDGRTGWQQWKVSIPWLPVVLELIQAWSAREIAWPQRHVAAGRIAKDVVPVRGNRSGAVMGEAVASVTGEDGVLQNRCGTSERPQNGPTGDCGVFAEGRVGEHENAKICDQIKGKPSGVPGEGRVCHLECSL